MVLGLPDAEGPGSQKGGGTVGTGSQKKILDEHSSLKAEPLRQKTSVLNTLLRESHKRMWKESMW